VKVCAGLVMTNLMPWPRKERKGEFVSGAKSVSGRGQRGVGKRVVMFIGAMARQSTMEK
jgi:hypothetical protein